MLRVWFSWWSSIRSSWSISSSLVQVIRCALVDCCSLLSYLLLQSGPARSSLLKLMHPICYSCQVSGDGGFGDYSPRGHLLNFSGSNQQPKMKNNFFAFVKQTRKLSYRKHDHAMHPMYGCPENFRVCPRLLFPKFIVGFCSNLLMCIQNLKFVALPFPEIIWVLKI